MENSKSVVILKEILQNATHIETRDMAFFGFTFTESAWLNVYLLIKIWYRHVVSCRVVCMNVLYVSHLLRLLKLTTETTTIT